MQVISNARKKTIFLKIFSGLVLAGEKLFSFSVNSIQWAVIFHLSGLAGLVFPGFGNWLAPLILWLIKKNEDPALDVVGKQVLNFQLSYTLYSLILGFVAAALTIVVIGFFLFPLLFVLFIMWLVFMIQAALKTSNGETYTYPFTIQFLK